MTFAGSACLGPLPGPLPGSTCRVHVPGPLPGLSPDRSPGHGEGPRGTESARPFVIVSTGVRAAPVPGSGAGGLRRWLVECSARPSGVHRPAGSKWSFLRIVLDERGPRNRLTQPLCIFAVSAGRPRASPRPAVLLGDRAAVPCRPVTFPERGPTTHGTIRTPHRSSEPRVVLTGPPLAGADTGTNDTVLGAVTRRTGERPPELRCDPGTAPGASWRGTYPACPAPRCSG
jgi:hypothetical protein